MCYGDHIGLPDWGPIALFIRHILTSSSRKELDEIEKAHVMCSIYNLLSNSRDKDDFSNGIHRSNDARERKLTEKKKSKKNHVRVNLKDIFGFAEHRDKCTYDLGYKSVSQTNSDNHVLGYPAGSNDAANLVLAGRVITDDISMFVQLYNPDISNQKLMLGHIVSRSATGLSYFKKSFYMKDVTTEIIWTFELGVGDANDIPLNVIVGLMQRGQFDQQHQNNVTFCRPSVVNAQCIIGT